MKIAIVHDVLTEFGGAERVLVALKDLYPEADVYTSFYNPAGLGSHRSLFDNWKIRTSWAQSVPLLPQLYSPLRSITPLIWESIDFKGYDLVISSSGGYMSKGIITRPETVHICYFHHPPRYLYYYETAREWRKYKLIEIYGNLINHNLRLWDYLGSQRVDHFVVNSEETKRRVQKFYRRDADVIYPPVVIPQNFTTPFHHASSSHYLTVSRLSRAKHIDLLIDAANKYRFELRVVGSGRDMQRLKSIAGKTVQFMGNVTDAELEGLYTNARGFLFAAVDEDFGISPIEAMGYGLPVIGYNSGGLKETVKHGVNGFLFNELTPESLYEQVQVLEKLSTPKYQEMSASALKQSAQYSVENFKKKMAAYVTSKLTRSE
ncbi:glycosyltransferase [Candidatus Microgenomates bacterium]|nr:glycosyltransferase [Candidatus Microgenomates bacterium]